MQGLGVRRFSQRPRFFLSLITGLVSMAVLGLMLACPLPAGAQVPEIVWVRQFDNTIFDEVNAVATTPSGIYVVGTVFGALAGQTSVGHYDIFLRKYDADGNELWTRQFGSSQLDNGNGIFADTSGVYVVGLVDLALPVRTGDALVRKYDASGNEIWTRQFGTAVEDVARAVSGDASGIYSCGEHQRYPPWANQ